MVTKQQEKKQGKSSKFDSYHLKSEYVHTVVAKENMSKLKYQLSKNTICPRFL
jgi:hypothetical protein